jgi:hypothetical protein
MAEANSRDSRLLVRRVRSLQRARANGTSWPEILAGQGKPGVLELIGRMLSRLGESGGNLRRALAGALRDQGLSTPAIAEAFGVSRQRVSNLLRRNHD